MVTKLTSKGLRVRRPTDAEGQRLVRIVRRGAGTKSHITWRRALITLASAGGNSVKVIADMAQTSPDRVREVIHAFNEAGLDCLDPKWAGGRPRIIDADDRALIVKVAKKRPRSLGRPFTRWSIRKLQKYLATKKGRKVEVSRERLRQILDEEKVTFQRTKTWKESPDPLREQKCARIEKVLNRFPDRTFAFDEFGPMAIKPTAGSAWAARSKPQRIRANYKKNQGTRMFFGCYSVGDDTIWGVIHPAKSQRNTLRSLRSIRATRPDGDMIYVILDNLGTHGGVMIETWCQKNNVELCFTPTYGSWANPIEAHFGPLKEFVLNNSDHRIHRALSRALHAYLRWRNENPRDPKILKLQRQEAGEDARGEADPLGHAEEDQSGVAPLQRAASPISPAQSPKSLPTCPSPAPHSTWARLIGAVSPVGLAPGPHECPQSELQSCKNLEKRAKVSGHGTSRPKSTDLRKK